MIRLLVVATTCLALCATTFAHDGEALRARHATLEAKLAHNPFGRPLHVVSEDSASVQTGEVYAVARHPYSLVSPALRTNQAWCAILLLQVNVKRCDAATREVSVFFGPADEAVEQAYRVNLAFEAMASNENYLRVALHGPEGPFGTRDYRIDMEAIPLPGGQTFLHLSYSYAPGWIARTAMRVYLAGRAREKVGFSVVDRRADGTPVFVEGVRAMIERNAMRYYLGIEAYMDSLGAPQHERVERRLRNWYAAIERYPLQLREKVSREEYLRTKRAQMAALRAGAFRRSRRLRPSQRRHLASGARPPVARRAASSTLAAERCGTHLRERCGSPHPPPTRDAPGARSRAAAQQRRDPTTSCESLAKSCATMLASTSWRSTWTAGIGRLRIRSCPSGPRTSPSKRLAEAGRILGIALLDHIVFPTGHHSFARRSPELLR